MEIILIEFLKILFSWCKLIISGKAKKININNSLIKSIFKYESENIIKRHPIRNKFSLNIFIGIFLKKRGKLKINKINANDILMKEKLSLVDLNTKNEIIKLNIKAKYVIFLCIGIIKIFNI